MDDLDQQIYQLEYLMNKSAEEAEDLTINEFEFLCGECMARVYVYARPHVCKPVPPRDGGEDDYPMGR